jgi:hypothetical protein
MQSAYDIDEDIRKHAAMRKRLMKHRPSPKDLVFKRWLMYHSDMVRFLREKKKYDADLNKYKTFPLRREPAFPDMDPPVLPS